MMPTFGQIGSQFILVFKNFDSVQKDQEMVVKQPV